MTQAVGTARTLYESAARTATPTAVTQINYRAERGGHFVIDVTAVTSTPSVTPAIEAYDAASDSWYPVLTGAAITATGTTILKVYPGIAVQANASAADILPQTWRLTMTHADTDSITYTVSANLVP